MEKATEVSSFEPIVPPASAGLDPVPLNELQRELREKIEARGLPGSEPTEVRRLGVNLCMEINSYLASAFLPHVGHSVTEGGPVTYPLFGATNFESFTYGCEHHMVKATIADDSDSESESGWQPAIGQTCHFTDPDV